MITATVTGVSAVQSLASRIAKNADRAAIKVIAEQAAMVLEVARIYVPVRTGRLYRSAGRRYGNGGRQVEAGFFDVPYAVSVHENPDAYHAPPTQYRFLSRAVFETRGARAALVRRHLGTGLRG